MSLCFLSKLVKDLYASKFSKIHKNEKNKHIWLTRTSTAGANENPTRVATKKFPNLCRCWGEPQPYSRRDHRYELETWKPVSWGQNIGVFMEQCGVSMGTRVKDSPTWCITLPRNHMALPLHIIEEIGNPLINSCRHC